MPFLRRVSRKGEEDTAATLSPVDSQMAMTVIERPESMLRLIQSVVMSRCLGHCVNASACDVEDVVLPLLHAIHVLLKADLLVTRLGGVVAQQLGHLGAVRGVLVHAQLEALAEPCAKTYGLLGRILSDHPLFMSAPSNRYTADVPEHTYLSASLDSDQAKGECLLTSSAITHTPRDCS